MFKSFFGDLLPGVNVKVGPVVIRDCAEKVGSVFGEEGRKVGKAIDSVTKDVTIDVFSFNKNTKW